MICPACRGKTRVMRTDQVKGGGTWRLRVCSSCEVTFETKETIETKSYFELLGKITAKEVESESK